MSDETPADDTATDDPSADGTATDDPPADGTATDDASPDDTASDDAPADGTADGDAVPDDGRPGAADRRCLCPLGGLMDLLSRQYAVQVVCVVGALQPVRYGEIEAAFGDVSSSTLSARLTELTDAELLAREQYDDIPPRVEYALTGDGEELCELLEPVLRWVEEREEGD